MANKKIVLCDTGIFFDYFQNDAEIMTELDSIGFENLAVCAVTLGEVYYGMKKREKRKTQELINRFGLFHINKEISIKFTQLMLAYPSGLLGIPDAIIAATAITCNVELYTLNTKDFDFIENLKLYKPKS